jgi:hypothetical protein
VSGKNVLGGKCVGIVLYCKSIAKKKEFPICIAFLILSAIVLQYIATVYSIAILLYIIRNT